MQQEFDLRRLQLTELQILKDIANFCDSNGINYFLYGGTLIGAARHQGFIPWDDDIDIWMDYKSYKKFLKL
jgi:lipopolysaccharide cholinephosphotransferase